jgi:hypothetical protein
MRSVCAELQREVPAEGFASLRFAALALSSWLDQGNGSHQRRLLAKALPEPDLKYRSSSRAFFSVLTAT